ncbi:probable jasmonic acid carboxyl methyltransferase 2 [Malania oleifera]|uniref:probable jasmonic acid carboxyl methyltransferase 2 n=1 Tax=Malania oleifera TaxID=397392 RepID=UPI0025AEC026|nr:probable jasmonic acid carboxyl methyltransferase 2 [Malania oleifera]
MNSNKDHCTAYLPPQFKLNVHHQRIENMEVMQVLHMNKGAGETSYARNSSIQSKIISITKPATEEAIVGLLVSDSAASMGVADLGCSSGPNALSVISHIASAVWAKCRRMGRPSPELRMYLNDLPCSDFNSAFGSLPALYDSLKAEEEAASGGAASFGPNCFVMGVPGSFYGRLLSSNSLHFVHSSSSLHWLSQVPGGLERKGEGRAINRGKVYISERSPGEVAEAYSVQFQKDFRAFLRSRDAEMVTGGRMVLSFMGRRSADPPTDDSCCCQWELLAQALMSLVSEGRVEEEKVDTFIAPFYAPSLEEVRAEIEEEGSFVIDRLEAIEIDWNIGGDDSSTISNFSAENDHTRRLQKLATGCRMAKMIRVVVESMIEYHFGFGGDVMDDLFQRYDDNWGDYLLMKTRAKFINLILSVIKKD